MVLWCLIWDWLWISGYTPFLGTGHYDRVVLWEFFFSDFGYNKGLMRCMYTGRRRFFVVVVLFWISPFSATLLMGVLGSNIYYYSRSFFFGFLV